jgi:hypothetical protein
MDKTEYWLHRARQCRRLAREANDARMTRALLMLADEYEAMASSASPPSPRLIRRRKEFSKGET